MFKRLKTNKKRVTAGVITGVATLGLSFTVLASIFGIDNLLGAIINPITKSKEITIKVNEEIELIETWDGTCELEAAALTPENIFEGGSGTEEDPYQIKTAEQLGCFAKSINNGTLYQGQYVKQTKNIKELLKNRNQYKFIPSNVTFDFLPQTSRKKDPLLLYELNFRAVRFQISDDMHETILTNLDRTEYPPSKIKELYASRWGIETSFRDLKYTVGMLNFHSKKTACIKQEIYSHLIMYNFAETITSQVSVRKKQRKHTYKVNFSVAVHVCRLYYRNKVTLPVLESIIAKNLIPIRINRHNDRDLPKKRAYHGFLYRVA